VNAVAPGLIETDMAAALPADARDALLAQVPLSASEAAREVAEMVGSWPETGCYVQGRSSTSTAALHVSHGVNFPSGGVHGKSVEDR